MAKAPNYTETDVELMTGMYLGVRDQDEAARNAAVKEIAETLDKGERSVRAKLARLFVPGTQEQLYVAKVTKSKVTGEAPAKKVELANRLISIARVDTNVVDAERVAKMNKVEIMAFIAAFEARDAAAVEAAEADDLAHSEDESED